MIQRAASVIMFGLVLSSCGEPSAEEQVAQGKVVYDQYCASCHGPEGRGTVSDWKTPFPNGTFPPPPHDSTGHTWHHSDALLKKLIREGGTLPGTTMPPFGQVLSEAEIDAVLAYIKTLWGPEERQFQEEISQRES